MPTNTPPPTNTPMPTNTPKPTNTPRPTNTSTPTSTATPEPEPVVLTGSGDAVVQFEMPGPLALAHIIGNATSRYFGVTSYDDEGNRVQSLVNTTDPYDGYRLVTGSSRFQVEAEDPWKIEVLPFSPALGLDFVLHVPGKVEGSGDYVLILIGDPPDTATIKGNAVGRFFAVIVLAPERHLLVNTTDPYEGTVIMPRDAQLLEILAQDSWSISVDNK